MTKKDDYEVGYGKPPKHAQFKPGQSGNRKGRPKGSKNRPKNIPGPWEERLKSLVQVEANRTVKVRQGEEVEEIPAIQAALRDLNMKAAQGNQRSQKMLFDMVENVEAENKARHDALLEAVINYKESWKIEFERLKAIGEPVPDLTMHPDDIKIDPRTGEVHVEGLVTDVQKKALDWFWDWLDDSDREIAFFKEMLAKSPDNEFWQCQLSKEEERRQRILDKVPKTWTDRRKPKS